MIDYSLGLETFLENGRFRLRKKCPYLELFWSAFSRILNTENSEYGHFSRRFKLSSIKSILYENTFLFQYLTVFCCENIEMKIITSTK